MARVGFVTTISAGKRLKTYALDRAATGTGNNEPITVNYVQIIHLLSVNGKLCLKKMFIYIQLTNNIGNS
jgi:hypothetical protein